MIGGSALIYQSLGLDASYAVGDALGIGTGVFFLAMAALRALQTETGTTFTGNWSWVPYIIVVVVLVLLAALAWYARGKRKEPS